MEPQQDAQTFEGAIQQVDRHVAPVIQEAGAIAAGIVNQAGYDRAAEYLTRNKVALDLAKALLEPFVAADFKKYKESRARVDSYIDPLKQKRAIVEPVAAAWLDEQERQRREAQRQAEEAARKRAEEEALAAAEAMEKAGDHEAAEAILQQPIVAAPIVLPKADQGDGISRRENWSGECVDLWSLVQAVAKDRNLLPCLKANDAVLNQLARAQKAEMRIPGVKVNRTGGLQIRRAA